MNRIKKDLPLFLLFFFGIFGMMGYFDNAFAASHATFTGSGTQYSEGTTGGGGCVGLSFSASFSGGTCLESGTSSGFSGTCSGGSGSVSFGNNGTSVGSAAQCGPPFSPSGSFSSLSYQTDFSHNFTQLAFSVVAGVSNNFVIGFAFSGTPHLSNTTYDGVRIGAGTTTDYSSGNFSSFSGSVVPIPTATLVPSSTPRPTTTPTITPSSTPRPTATPTVTVTPTPVIACGTACTISSQCANATGGCTICDPGTHSCQTPKQCGGTCTGDPDCANISGGCNTCQGGVCTVPGATALAFVVNLDGIGNAGDNANRTDTSLNNKQPNTSTRNFVVTLLNGSALPVATKSGTISYNTANNADNFIGNINVGNLPTGDYQISAKSDRYLSQLFAGIVHVVSGQTTQIPPNHMVAGDVNDNNQLDVVDYSIMLDCGYGALHPLRMTDPNSAYNTPLCQGHQFKNNADLDDNGIIDQDDFNLYVRELSIQNGA